MKQQDVKKIKSVVYSCDNIKEVNKLLKISLTPMRKSHAMFDDGEASFSDEELRPFIEKIDSIRADLSQLQEDLMTKIYKCPDS